MNNRIVGRVALNFLMYGLVIGFLQIIPKLYNKAEGKGNAGLKGLVKEEPSAQKEEADKNYTPQMGEVYKVCPYCNTKVKVTAITCPNCKKELN